MTIASAILTLRRELAALKLRMEAQILTREVIVLGDAEQTRIVPGKVSLENDDGGEAHITVTPDDVELWLRSGVESTEGDDPENAVVTLHAGRALEGESRRAKVMLRRGMVEHVIDSVEGCHAAPTRQRPRSVMRCERCRVCGGGLSESRSASRSKGGVGHALIYGDAERVAMVRRTTQPDLAGL